MEERKAYHPIERESATHLIGKDILCSNTREGLGYWATLIRIDFDSRFPYVCELSYNNRMKSFKWIASY